MTNQQLQYAYWQRMRQQQLHRALVAGNALKKNSYDKIARVSDDCFLNFIEYSPKNIDSQKAVDYLKNAEHNLAFGGCTGVYEKDSGMAVRQLDWYYNNETEFIVKMNADQSKGVFASIGVTAASPKLTRDLTEQLIASGRYYDFFDVLPFFTVDGMNENGIFAQSNVVNKNGVEININPSGKDCCIVMVVRYILDHFTREDIKNADAVKSKLKDNLHIYGTIKLGGYNSHILIAHYDDDNDYNKSYVVEFTENDCIVNEFPIITNFRTFFMNGSVPHPIGTKQYSYIQNWGQIESNGIGVERWNAASQFLSAMDDQAGATMDDCKSLRQQLNYTHAYDRPFESYKTWLTDNLSGDLTVEDAKNYHDGYHTTAFDEALAGYRAQFDERSRDTGLTWHTTHSTIYDLANLSCNIQSQEKETCWNVLLDGTISVEPAKVTLMVQKAYDTDEGSQARLFVNDEEKQFGVPMQFDKGTTVKLEAFPPESYAVEHFLHWSDDPTHSIYSSTRYLTVDQSVQLTAMFHANFS